MILKFYFKTKRAKVVQVKQDIPKLFNFVGLPGSSGHPLMTKLTALTVSLVSKNFIGSTAIR